MKLIGFDYETYLIGKDAIIPKPVCLSYWENDAQKGLAVGMEEMEKLLRTLLNDKNSIKVAHNLTFEFLVTYKYFPKLRKLLWETLEEGRFFCTDLQQHLINNLKKKPINSTSLANLLNVYLEIDIQASKKDPDAWRLRYSELDGVALEDWPEAAIEYAMDDSKYCLSLYKYYEPRYITKKLVDQLPHLKSSVVLNMVASRGILTNKERVSILEKEVTAALVPAYKELHKLGFMKHANDKKEVRLKKDGTPYKTRKKEHKEDTNPWSKNMKALKEYIKENFKKLQFTKEGGISTEGSSLDYYLLENPNDVVIQYFRFIGKYEKLLSAFIKRLKEADPYIYTYYNPIVRSGRTSSRANSNYPSINIQQQPR